MTDDLPDVSWHEGAHAVIARHFGFRVTSVKIEANGRGQMKGVFALDSALRRNASRAEIEQALTADCVMGLSGAVAAELYGSTPF